MSAWTIRNGTGSSVVAGTGGGRNFQQTSDLPSASNMGGTYRPTGANAPAKKDPVRPGSVNIDITDPSTLKEQAIDPIGDLFDGLRQAVVGQNENRDVEGFVDKSQFGSVPVLGNVLRGGADLLGGAGEVFGGVTAAIGGGLERVGQPGAHTAQLDEAYNDPYLQAWLDEIDPATGEPRRAEFTGDKGLGGTGILASEAHFKSKAVREFAASQQFDRPSIAPGAFTPPGSVSDTIANLFDLMDVSAQKTASIIADWDRTGEGTSRISQIKAVGDSQYDGDGSVRFAVDEGLFGTGAFAGDPDTQLNALEDLVYQKMKSGDWTEEAASEFLAANYQAFGHDAISNIGGAIFADPINLLTVGALGVAKIGLKGAQITKIVVESERILKAAEEAVVVARQGTKYLRRADRIAKAKKNLRVAQALERKARKAVELNKEYHSVGGGIKKTNVLARTVEGSTKIQSGMKKAGKLYGGLSTTNAEGRVVMTSIGRASKITRTIIDPLHGLDMRNPARARILDLYSDSLPRSVADTAGVHHYKGIEDDLLRLDPTGELHDSFIKDFAVAVTNMGRDGALEMFRAAQIDAGMGSALMRVLPEDLMETAISSTRHRDLERWLRAQTTRVVMKMAWSEAEHVTLAKQLDQTYHMAPKGGWLAHIKSVSKEQKSLYKLAAYGRANQELLAFGDLAKVDAALAARLPNGMRADRMVLLAKGTLSRLGAESLLTQLSAGGGKRALKRKIAVIEKWQEQYPSLRYLTMDPANMERSVDNFVEYLKDNMDRYPMQMTEDELKALGTEGDALKSVIGEYGIGFKPKDEFLMGLERENGTGLYRPAGSGWADHVATSSTGYRPASILRTNILGHPLVGVPVVRAAARMIDHVDSSSRIMRAQVSGAQIAEAARARFIARATTGDLAEHGVTERVANDWFERITQYSKEQQGYSGPRGYGADDLYKAIKKKNLIPQALLNGDRRLSPEDVMRLVMEAYDGDIRTIGLTQKLSGRAKRYLFELTGGNFAGQIAEHAWPTLKFRYNPIFQLQEKIEPWVLNTQRGVNAALSSGMNDADMATEALLQRMTNNSLVRQSDLDQYEYSSEVLLGKVWKQTLMKPGTAMNKVQRAARTISDVQGMKRVNMLRTFRKGLGREVREAWDVARPGEFDQMLTHASGTIGRQLGEDEFALKMMTENLFANDVIIRRLDSALATGGLKAEWGNAIKPGVWMSPTHMGELKALDLEHVAQSLRIVGKDGEEIKDLVGLRKALATEPDMMDKIKDGLKRHGATDDYTRRVENSLNFSWNGFWKEAATRFSLTSDESRALQDMFDQAASMRGMNPVDFMSQVFSPSLIDGTEGVLGHLDGPVGLLREARAAGRKMTPRAAKIAESRTKLAGEVGVSTREDLVRQISRTFSAHLDPSAKRALLMEFQPELKKAVLEGRSRLDLADIESLWSSLGENQFSDRLLGFMDGVRPTHAFDVLDDEVRGVLDVRNGATRYMQQQGVEPLPNGNHFRLDAEAITHGETGAAHYGALPEVDFHRTGRIPNRGSLNKSSTELKPKPDAVDQRTYDSYQTMNIDVRNQFDFMTKPKAKGGLGLEVTVSKTEPYADVAAMRVDIAKGRLKVFGGNSDHALMTNDQNVMLRAVHDVFGYGAEGYERGARGELNAAASHARMFSNEGRPAMLTETHGRTSYANYSDDAFDADAGGVPRRVQLDSANPAEDFERMHPFDPDRRARELLADPNFPREYIDNSAIIYGKGPKGNQVTLKYEYKQRVGAGIRAMSPEYQRAILQPISDLLQEFPDLKIRHIDILDFSAPLESSGVGRISGMGYGEGASALTWPGAPGESVIIFNKRFFESYGGPDWNNVRRTAEWHKERNAEQFWDSFMRDTRDRRSNIGTPNTAGPYSPAYIARHESGHAFDSMRRPKTKKNGQWVLMDPWEFRPEFLDMMTRFEGVASGMDLSKYGLSKGMKFREELMDFVQRPGYDPAKIADKALRDMAEELTGWLDDTNQYHAMMARFERTGANMDLSEYGLSNSQEFAAELFSFVTDPRYDKSKIVSESLRDMSEEFRQYLIDSGEWVPMREAIDSTRVLDNLPAPGFARSRVFASHKGDLVYRTDGVWGPGMYVSDDATAAARSGKQVASFIVPTEDVLDLSTMLPTETITQTIEAMLAEGHDGGAQYLSAFIKRLGLDPATTKLDDVANMAEKSPAEFHAALKAEQYIGFKTAKDTVIIDPRALKRETADVFARNAPAPAPSSTVRAANEAQRGTVSAPNKAGLLPQEYLDDFTDRFVGRGKHIESNPDVSRAAQMFGKWTDAAVNNGLLKSLDGGTGIYGELLSDIGKLPTGAAVPYNFTEGAAINLATQSMVRKWDDAFRLQYFAQERSVAERSLNHPMFGIYPASYMWGKIMPELVKFIAAEPFGNKTGGMLMSMIDAQAAIAIRREQDPEFDANIEQMGHSQALSFAGFLMPAVPWDLGAGAPGWMQSIAGQGLANKKKADAGQYDKQKDVSYTDAATSTLKKLAPLTTTIPWMGRALDEINGQTEEEKLAAQVQTDKLVRASELSPFMAQAVKELREALK